jgi:DNA-binding helix-hairpin-helix protein with protein kinase domain
MMLVYDQKGNQIQLISTDKKGGEGSIYLISGQKDKCAKIYRSDKINPELYAKIKAMVQNPPLDPMFSRGHHSIVWPESVLYSDQTRTKFVGFIMPFLDLKEFREAHIYYSSSDRQRNFGGGFSWKYLLITACNLSSSVEAIHFKKHCIGDLKETNILVSSTTLITLVDCDSFQIMDKASGRVYYTRVGTADYLPPELHNANFNTSDIDRKFSDLFALGIFIFKFLMNGIHPYAATGELVAGANTTAAKILKGYFAFSGKYGNVKPPEFAPPYHVLPSSIQDLFERCFIIGHNDPYSRPTAREWFQVLYAESERLCECSVNSNHIYSRHLSQCPWCDIYHRQGVDHFPEKPIPSNIGQQIQLPKPTTPSIQSNFPQPYPQPSQTIQPSVRTYTSGTPKIKVGWIVTGLCVIGIIIIIISQGKTFNSSDYRDRGESASQTTVSENKNPDMTNNNQNQPVQDKVSQSDAEPTFNDFISAWNNKEYDRQVSFLMIFTTLTKIKPKIWKNI